MASEDIKDLSDSPWTKEKAKKFERYAYTKLFLIYLRKIGLRI
jgi:hypothetical protein